MKIRFRDDAIENLEDIYVHLKGRSISGAHNVLDAIYEAITFIERQPYGAEETDDGTLRVKILTKYPYKVFYDIGRSTIEIVHIRHGAREPRK